MTDATKIPDKAAHTPTPWSAASRYSSVVGVPIVNQQGKRVGNTALPDMPPEWDHMKRQAEIDAAFICEAVNSYDRLRLDLERAKKALEEIDAVLSGDRATVNDSNALHHFGVLNRLLCHVRDISRATRDQIAHQRAENIA